MNKLLISASAVCALCAVQAHAETEFGGMIGSVYKTTAAGSEYYTDVFVHVDGSAGRFFAARDGKENKVGYSNDFGNFGFLIEQNLTSEVTKIAAKYSVDKFSFGGEALTNDEWNVWGRYDADSYYAGLKINQADVVTATAGYKQGGLSLGMEANTNDEWNVGVGYAEGDYWVGAGYEFDEDYKFEGGYKINDNFKLHAGHYVEDAGATEKTKVGIAFTF